MRFPTLVAIALAALLPVAGTVGARARSADTETGPARERAAKQERKDPSRSNVTGRAAKESGPVKPPPPTPAATPKSTAKSAPKPAFGAAASTPARERQLQCGQEWRSLSVTEKAARGPGWPQFYSRCVKRLKAEKN